MDQAPLVMDEIAAGADLIRQLDKFVPIQEAFWLRRDEEDERNLYLASDQFNQERRVAAYGEVTRITEERPAIFLDPMQVSLIPADDRWAVAARRIREERPDRRGNRIRSQRFGDRYVADAYIYPLPLAEEFPKLF